MRKLIKRFARYVAKENNYSSDQEEQVEYGMKIVVFEALKIIGVILIFSLLGFFVQAIVAILSMAIVKPFIGGYHEDSQIKCFGAMIVIAGFIITIESRLPLDFISMIILNFTSIYTIWFQAPIVSKIMPITRTELLQRNRNIGVFLTSNLIIISIIITLFFNNYKVISQTITWTLLYQAILMFSKKGIT
jgi:accessory gene regulator B